MRALLVVLDGLGVGAAPDAAEYGDIGANTLRHICEKMPEIELPTLGALGLGEILDGTDGKERAASYGRMRPRSVGKDTTTGHWEIAGVILDEPFATFEKFPDVLVAAIEKQARVRFIGNYAQSGTKILEELGEEHVRTGRPILYTSADSVMQIAAHEEIIPPSTLSQICRIARRHCDAFRIGRVIARPFTGRAGKFERTANRHDYSILPPRTGLNAISETGFTVEGVGKIDDIFAGSGITHSHPTTSNAHGMATIEALWKSVHDGLIFANLVDFDMLFGHRRDVAGYAAALVEFDRWLDGFLDHCEEDDLIIITADHGNDPTFPGSDHTREEVPLLVRFDGKTQSLGTRSTFADVAATLCDFFDVKEKWPTGTPLMAFDKKRTHPFVQQIAKKTGS
ncbi:MAG: phosphopentomutase [Verrucomicrobiota bacterium]|nr:phosphopentomutase [Verrucomicrobiota bacterium]